MGGVIGSYANTDIGVLAGANLKFMNCNIAHCSKYGLAVKKTRQVNNMNYTVTDAVTNLLNDNTFDNNSIDVISEL